MLRTVAAVLAALALTVVCSCASSGGSGPERAGGGLAAAEQLAASPWVLMTIDGAGIPKVARRPSLTVTLAGAVGGFGGVNRIAGRTDPEGLKGGRLTLGNLVSTKMAGPPELMELETNYLAALGRVTSYRVTAGDGLTLSDGAGRAVLTFVRE